MRRALRAGARLGLAVALMTTAIPARGESPFHGIRRLEVQPGERWLETPRSGLRVAAGVPVEGTASSSAWMRLGLPRLGAFHARVGAAQLRAAAYQRIAVEAGGRLSLPGLSVGVAVTGIDERVLAIHGQRRGRVESTLVMRLGELALGALVETAFQPRQSSAPPVVEIGMRLARPEWGLGMTRRSSAFGAGPVWRFGLGMRLSTAFTLAATSGPGGAELVLLLGSNGRQLRLALPVASVVGAGPMVGVDWGFGDAPASP